LFRVRENRRAGLTGPGTESAEPAGSSKKRRFVGGNRQPAAKEEQTMKRSDHKIAGALFMILALLALSGCAKKQVVKPAASAEAPPAVAAAPSVEAPTSTEAEEGITSETLPPEASLPIGTGSTPEGLAVTQEGKSALADIHFDFDQSLIRPDDKPNLETVDAYLVRHPGSRLVVQGNCDERGTSEYNMALGERRAEAAKKYLVLLGIPDGSIGTISFGKEKPLDPAHDETAWAKNRRDHFEVK
jgi:peptidoglycan-associated lipoprotein